MHSGVCRFRIRLKTGAVVNRLVSVTDGYCRRPLLSSRSRRSALAESLAVQWRELRRYATIEKDSEKLTGLLAAFDQRQAEAIAKRDVN
jgi:hypothetical protein